MTLNPATTEIIVSLHQQARADYAELVEFHEVHGGSPLIRCKDFKTWQAADRLALLSTQVENLRETLKLIVEEKCDYMLINNLGDPEKQHTVKVARAILLSTKP